jgi:Uma2 family endonuclease
LAQLTREQKRVFIPLCPDFVIELASPSDSLPRLKRKMREWIENGAQLGWLIHPESRSVHVFRASTGPEDLIGVDRIGGEGPVAGFTLDLTGIWAEL